MFMRLRALPWGWMTIGLAYGVAVLPILASQRMAWLALATALAYLVLARRTTIQTAQIAQSHENKSVLGLWGTAFRATWFNRGLLVLPMFCLMLAAKVFMLVTPEYCSTLFRAYCMTYGETMQVEQYLISATLLGTFLLLDHGLLVALALLAHKHLPKSASFVGNTAVGLRFALACAVLSVVAVSVNILEFSTYWRGGSITDRRVLETIYPSFEPLVTNGVMLGANVLNRSSYCYQYGGDGSNSNLCLSQTETRPAIARQIVSGLLGILMYGGLLLGVLWLAMPFSFGVHVKHKAKRTETFSESEIVHI